MLGLSPFYFRETNIVIYLLLPYVQEAIRSDLGVCRAWVLIHYHLQFMRYMYQYTTSAVSLYDLPVANDMTVFKDPAII